MDEREELLLGTYKSLADKYSADVYQFNANVDYLTADAFIHTLRSVQKRRDNCILLLTTYGGDPDAGYRIVRTIKRYYAELILLVFGACKSTGTLMALGADKIIMSDFSELGPLDIQLTKDDELINMSGLNYLQSLMSLNENTFRFFEQNFLNIKEASSGTISTKTAAEIASKIAIGLTAPISGQIDPVKLGEVQRAMNIADAYGDRLACGKNERFRRLITSYPSHEFVIDVTEAKEIFDNVEEAADDELVLEHLLLKEVRKGLSTPLIKILLSEKFFDGNPRYDVVQEDKNGEVASDLPETQLTSQTIDQTSTENESPHSTSNQQRKNGKESASRRTV